MRVYNGTKKVINLPLSNTERIVVGAKSVSGDIMPSTNFLSLLVGSYDYSELALIVSGPYEINMCSQVSGCAGFVVQSLEEAIERFAEKEEKKVVEEKKVEVKQQPAEKPENKVKEKKEKVIETPSTPKPTVKPGEAEKQG